MRYGPDYQFSYIENTIQQLNLRGLVITPAEILQGLWMIEDRGIEDNATETALYSFLHRLTPFAHGHLLTRRFQGWESLGNDLNTIPGTTQDVNSELARRFGMDAVRVAAVVRNRFAPSHSS